MKNILILLLIFCIGFGSAWYLRGFDIIMQVKKEEYKVKDEHITEWKKQWCSESCGTPVINISEVCSNFMRITKEEAYNDAYDKTYRENQVWLRGYENGYKAREVSN